MLTKRFIPHSIRLDAGNSVAAWIDHIDSYGMDLGASLFEESSGSEIDREYAALKDVAPTLSIGIKDLSFIGTCGLAGLPFYPASGHPGLIAWGREIANGATPTAIATTNHLKMLVSDGMLVPVKISAGHNSVARLELMLHAILGTVATYSQTAPVVFSTGAAITSGASATTKIYTAGPVSINGTIYQGIQDLSVDFGINVLKESDSGDVYPSHASIIGRNPKISFTTKNAELIAAIQDGLELTSFSAFFKRTKANAQRYADNTSSHIKISGTSGIIVPGSASFQHMAPGSASYTITPVLNSSILTISTASAIS